MATEKLTAAQRAERYAQMVVVKDKIIENCSADDLREYAAKDWLAGWNAALAQSPVGARLSEAERDDFIAMVTEGKWAIEMIPWIEQRIAAAVDAAYEDAAKINEARATQLSKFGDFNGANELQEQAAVMRAKRT